MSNLTMQYTGTLTIVTCPGCDMTYGIPVQLAQDRQRDHKSVHCPRGHTWYWPGESDIEKATRLKNDALARARRTEATEIHLREQLGATERSLAGHKAAKTRLKNRIAAGACPCCHRTFQNVARHMAGQHPDFADGTA